LDERGSHLSAGAISTRLTVFSVLRPGVVQFGGCGRRKREPIADDMSLDVVRACIVRARNLKGT
jgi:hypothetical protein